MRNQIKRHPLQSEIEVLIVARCPMAIIESRFGVSRFCLYRRGKQIREGERPYFIALRRALRERGVNRRTFINNHPEETCQSTT